jgi:hypothetical protein
MILLDIIHHIPDCGKVWIDDAQRREMALDLNAPAAGPLSLVLRSCTFSDVLV